MRANSVLPVLTVAVATVLLSQALDAAAGEIAPRPQDTDPGLLFTEMVVKPGETGSRTLRLVRANFRNGKLTGREEHALQPGKLVPLSTAQVWSAATGEWQTIDGWADSLIAWVK